MFPSAPTATLFSLSSLYSLPAHALPVAAEGASYEPLDWTPLCDTGRAPGSHLPPASNLLSSRTPHPQPCGRHSQILLSFWISFSSIFGPTPSAPC